MSSRKKSVQESWNEWFKPYDEKQTRWIFEYLVKRSIGRNDLNVSVGTTTATLPHWFYSLTADNLDKAQLLLKEMKAAWSRKNSRDKNSGRKGYSFDMGNDIQQKLKKLAEGYDLPINITLEAIIRDSAQFKEKLRAEQKANLEKMKLDFQEKEEKLQLQKSKHETVTQRYKREIELLNKLIEDLLDKNFKKDLIFRAKKITDYAISEDEELQVMEQVEKELNDLKKEIKKEVNKISSLEHLMTYDVIPY